MAWATSCLSSKRRCFFSFSTSIMTLVSRRNVAILASAGGYLFETVLVFLAQFSTHLTAPCFSSG